MFKQENKNIYAFPHLYRLQFPLARSLIQAFSLSLSLSLFTTGLTLGSGKF
jgi:hypothetical protein